MSNPLETPAMIPDESAWLNPPAQFRPRPFLSLNDKLESSSLQALCQAMLAQGYGGYFLHSRRGLKTEYLSKEWFEALNGPINLARQTHSEAWLYDEDTWPSGFAGGEVVRQNEDFRPHLLCVESVKVEELLSAMADRSTLCLYHLKLNEKYEALEFHLIPQSDLPDRGIAWRFFTVTPPNRPRFNNSAYIDTLNPKAVQTFIELTYQPYVRHYKKHFGPNLPGIMTDEPRMPTEGFFFNQLGGVPWTPTFPQYFKNRAGYDLMAVLPYLFFKGPQCHQVRYDFWRLMGQRFTESYTDQVVKFCEKNNLQLTGHLDSEDTLVSQVPSCGAVMPHYWRMQVPGVDHLGRNIAHPLTLRQVSSVAAQAGKKQAMSELFGVCGQDMTFADQKWIGDYHLVNGINFFVPHLTLYSFAGDRKRDYPPTFSPHQPWWPHLKSINDYFARGAWFISQGRYQADILLLHPIASVWAGWQPKVKQVGRGFLDFENLALAELDSQLDRLICSLAGAQREFDLGDETILAEHAEVGKGTLQVGRMSYPTVIIPPSLNWSSRTLQMLQSFAAKGGHVLVAGSLPTMLDGQPAAEPWAKLADNKNVNRTGSSTGLLMTYLSRLSRPFVQVQNQEGKTMEDIWVRRSVVTPDKQPAQHWLFAFNRSRTATHHARLTLTGVGGVTRWNLLTGERTPMPVQIHDGHTVLQHVFAPGDSLALVFDPAQKPLPQPKQSDVQIKPLKRLRSPWGFVRSHPNSLVLDFCKFRMANGRYAKPSPVWKARNAIREFAGFGPYVGVQPYILKKYGTDGVRPIAYSMLFEFESRLTKKPVVALVMENAELMTIKVNDKAVAPKPGEWHWDERFSKMDVGAHLKKGLNTIELIAEFKPEIEIEDIHLIGNFATKRLTNTSYALVDEPSSLKDGDWTKQGYHFYAGNVTYSKTTELKVPRKGRLLLKLRDPKGTGYRISVNGQFVTDLFWEPWLADITPAIKRGKNQISIEVLGSLRNTFGPLHNLMSAQTSDYWWGPGSFTDEKNWSDAYLFSPSGLIEGAEILVSE